MAQRNRDVENGLNQLRPPAGDPAPLMKRMNALIEEHTWAFDRAVKIVENVEPDGRLTYQLPAGKKIQLMCEIAEALLSIAYPHQVRRH